MHHLRRRPSLSLNLKDPVQNLGAASHFLQVDLILVISGHRIGQNQPLSIKFPAPESPISHHEFTRQGGQECQEGQRVQKGKLLLLLHLAFQECQKGP